MMDKETLVLAGLELMERIENPEARKVAMEELYKEFVEEAKKSQPQQGTKSLDCKEMRVKSLDSIPFETKNFTGRIRDAMGRQRCYQGGKIVPCSGQEEKTPEKNKYEHREQPDEAIKGEEDPTGQGRTAEEQGGNQVPQGGDETSQKTKQAEIAKLINTINGWLEQVQRQSFFWLKQDEQQTVLEPGTLSVLQTIVKSITEYLRAK